MKLPGKSLLLQYGSTVCRNTFFNGLNRIQQGLSGILWLPGKKFQKGVFMTEPWLSADDIAAHLGVAKDTVYNWIAEKSMPAHKIGRLWKFQTSEVDDWVRRGGASADVS